MMDLPQYITEAAYSGYQVRFKRKDIKLSQFFSWSVYGSKEKALKAATKWRNQVMRELELPSLRKSSRRRTTASNNA